ncbi:MAG: hypothetical protein MJ064_03065 [Lachnospiraceae bacterium]|nr:hypothetical protein [Lachnospiraceae bacterium]
MDYLRSVGSKEAWEEFYAYCTSNEHIVKSELKELRQFIDCGSFLSWYERIVSGDFPIAERTVLNKKGTAKKRVVYMFPGEAGWILKYLSFRLHAYDDCFADNLYSFRVKRGVKRAVSDILAIPGLRNRYVYKLDIHDYFNSVSVEAILPMLKELLYDEQPGLYSFIEAFLRNPYVYADGERIEETKGIMAGNPLSAFLANLYLSDMDHFFEGAGIPYARYSDDMIVFAESEEQLSSYREEILRRLSEKGMTVNPAKVFLAAPGETWDFLGITYRDGAVDIAKASVEKLKHKMKRKARALYRWKVKRQASDEQTIRAYIRHFNRKLYDNPAKGELTWCRWFFPVITTTDSLKELDTYMVACIRYLKTGRYSKANYSLRYETIRSYGFRSLVHAYYESDRFAAVDMPLGIEDIPEM